jgi:hypothetical protein
MTMYQIRVDFPLYAVLDDDCRTPAFFQGTTSGEVGMAVCTTEEKLREYQQQTGKVSPLLRFDWAGQILLYADTLRLSMTGLWIDPTKDNKRLWGPLSKFMEYFQRTDAPG